MKIFTVDEISEIIECAENELKRRNVNAST